MIIRKHRLPLHSSRHPAKQPLHHLGMLSIAGMVSVLSACSTVSVDQLDTSKVIANERGNIVSENRLSNQTSSALFSAGLNEQGCLNNFSLCTQQLSNSLFHPNSRPELAIFAELNYAKAKQLNDTEACQRFFERPPIDPYYANAPLPEDQQAQADAEMERCLADYQGYLFNSIKYSYGYLFYDALTQQNSPSADSPTQGAGQDAVHNAETSRLSHLPNEVDIQTQDIYNAATNEAIIRIFQGSKKACLIREFTI